jgi:hypothetical protein
MLNRPRCPRLPKKPVIVASLAVRTQQALFGKMIGLSPVRNVVVSCLTTERKTLILPRLKGCRSVGV